MGACGKTAHRNLQPTSRYRYILVDKFDEEGADLIDYTEDGRCLYLGHNWDDRRHTTYAVVLRNEANDFLNELVTYKFGHIDLPMGEWYYFVWSEQRPTIVCDVFRKFYENIQKDSQRFWRTIRLLIKNMEGGDGS